jgi:Ribbon-helix-helix protein, copG family
MTGKQMNFSIYIPDDLAQKLNTIAHIKHISRNLIVREALEEWMEAHTTQQWPTGFFDFRSVEEVPDFTSYRAELTQPKEEIF